MKSFKSIRNKGFSLVELIIVVAIMVALIAVLAPNYIKYVQTSRDAVVENAAESVSESIKLFFSDSSFTSADCMFVVEKNSEDELDITLKSGNFTFNGIEYNVNSDITPLKNACGFEHKKVKSDKQFSIVVSALDDTISMSSTKYQVEVEEVPDEGNN